MTAHTFWRGEHIVLQRDDGTADIYAWEPTTGSYAWLGDYTSTDEAERYVREMEALPEFPEIKPITTAVAECSDEECEPTEEQQRIILEALRPAGHSILLINHAGGTHH